MAHDKRLCLNMIVKNEMANLDRCLRAVVDHIDCWVIGDTGSTDGTQDFIKSFFADRGIPGELHSFPFINFEQARNAALEHAVASKLTYDYLLFDDADMELVVEDRDFRAKLNDPGYRLIQRTDTGFFYWNTRMVRREIGARYHGVTHEYIDVPGGVKELRGVWYKDHASGSNRVEKFQRDIDLLTKALKQEPNNERYWFYLAQSYRDAGQKAKAAETYGKRAKMGGFDEEAWNARLQQARCLKDLKDEGGFIREALAAFNQRPQRAEPLYDLARFFRERGDNAASVLFSEFGLTLPRPDDILFLEDFVYRAGLREEYSIAANYSRDAARKDRGFAACNWLALSREIPQNSRTLARNNLRFYVRPAGASMPSFASRQIAFTVPEGFHALNPSVARLGDQLVLIQRAANFEVVDGKYGSTDGGPIRTRNFLLRLDAELNTQSAIEILPPADMPVPLSSRIQGFEDARLFAWRGELWCVACFREQHEQAWAEQWLARIAADGGECHLTSLRRLQPQADPRPEKNWMPLVDGDTLQFIYAADPTRLVDEHGATVKEAVPPIAADSFRGGSQAVSFDEGWLVLIHEVVLDGPKRHYSHRFVWFDRGMNLKRVTRPFFFQRSGIEFAAGLAWHPDGKRLVISYGVADVETWIATVNAEDVRRVLEDAERLLLGTPENRLSTSPPDAMTANAMAIADDGRSAAQAVEAGRQRQNDFPEFGENQTRPGYSAVTSLDHDREPEEEINSLLQTLRHLVGKRPIALLDWPFYPNAGDHLIWLGEKVLFKEKLGCKVLYECSLEQFNTLAISRLPSDAVVVMHGGGNFGDLYDHHQRFREAMVGASFDRRIIFMPQTVHFTNQENLEKCASRLRLHPDLHVMARDRKSLDIIRSQMGLANCYLHIDSAFALQSVVTALQRKFALKAEHDVVYLLRSDIESIGEVPFRGGITRYDWGNRHDVALFANDLPNPKSVDPGGALDGEFDTRSWVQLCAAIRMLATGERIVTDRLHGHILATMMKKQHELYDNNYGKNRSFYQTWTKNCPLVTFVGRAEDAKGGIERGPKAEINCAAKLSNEEPHEEAVGATASSAEVLHESTRFSDEIGLRHKLQISSAQNDVPFPAVFIINLDKRADRWTTIESACRDCGLEAARVPAEHVSPGWVGCGRSHLKVIRNAKEKSLPWVLILEDDACFDIEGITRFRALLPYLWENRDKWERFSGAPHFPRNPDVRIFDIHHQLMYIRGRATQFDLIQSAAYDSILTWDSANGRPLDAFYYDLADKGFRSICTYPHIATQTPSVSDIENDDGVIDQARFFRYSSEKLRECLNSAAPQAQGMKEINAVHPRWKGVLCVSEEGNFLWHKGTKSLGTYEYRDGLFIAHWYDYPEEAFVEKSGSLMHADLVTTSQRVRAQSTKTVGLCMIVKNESKVILRCLESVRPLVDYVLIEDTGSTDNTQTIIRNWLDRVGLPGEVYDEPWKDFAYNRSHALEKLRKQKRADYALVIDADDYIVFEPGFDVTAFKNSLSDDLYDVEFQHGLLRYRREQIFKNRRAFRYRGVLHEFVEAPPGSSMGSAKGFYISTHREGARSQDPDKYRKDARVLEGALKTEKDKFLRSRYTFYLARSYRDAGEKEKAIKNFLARAELGYWTEEIFVSLYFAGQLRQEIGRPFEEVLASYLRASDAAPTRAEALHAASRLCRQNEKFAEGYEYARRGLAIPFPSGGLFVETWQYDYGLLDELAINAYWLGKYAECVDACDRLLREGKLPMEQRERVLKNKQFAIDKLTQMQAQPTVTLSEPSISAPKIPRIFHFITGLAPNFGGKPFSFVHYMAIHSALQVNEGFRARVYYHYEPSGKYWDAIKGEVELVRVDLPTEVFGNPVQIYAHKADVLRMQILLEQGGIYLDLDTICQRPFEPLLDGRVVMGREERLAPDGNRIAVGLCNATIIAPPNAEFLRLWYEAYREFKGGTSGDGWNKFSVQVPMALAKEHPDLLRIEPASSFFWPTWDQAGIASMFEKDCAFPDAYSFHLWEGASFKFTKELDLQSVLTVDTTYNRLARRFVEDGQPALECIARQFSKVYDQGVWGPGSGVGSLPQHTVEYRDFLKKFIQENGIKSVVDFGCGDWQFSRHIDWSGVTYTGFDVVESLIEKNQREFGKDGNISFHKFDSLDKLPPADLLICKDVLQHLSNNLVKAYLAAFKQRYKFCLVTNDDEPAHLQNIDIAAGGWRTLRLDLKPFSEPGRTVLSWTVPWGKATTHKVTYLIHGS